MRIVITLTLALLALVTTTALPPATAADQIDQLLTDLRSIDPMVRVRASSELINVNDPRIIDPLVPFLTDNLYGVRVNCAGALVKFGDVAAEKMLNIIKESGEEPIFSELLYTLGTFEKSAAMRVMTPHLKSPNDRLRLVANIVLAGYGVESVLGYFLDLYQSDDKVMRLRAIEAMKNLNNARVMQVLIKALKDPYHAVRETAYNVLIKRNYAGASFNDHLSFLVAGKRWTSLAKTGPKAIPAVIPLLKDEDPSIRSSALGVLGDIKDPSVSDLILSASKDPDGGVRMAAETAWMRIHGQALPAPP